MKKEYVELNADFLESANLANQSRGRNLDTNEKINYKIVCKNEADIKKKLIYFQSPIGRGLIGKNKNYNLHVTC